VLLLASFLAAGCATGGVRWEKDDYKIWKGRFKRGDTELTLNAFHIPSLGVNGTEVDVVAPALAHIGEMGGNTVAIDLAGFNADGTALDPVSIATVQSLAERTKDQRMALIVRVLADRTDPSFRANATVTAANALSVERKALYWFDGPDAAHLAKIFKLHAPALLVAAPANGELRTVTAVPAEGLGVLDILVGKLPSAKVHETHFIVASTPENYTALDEAVINYAAQQPWTPDNSVLSEAERNEGFIALFNGKNLDGWWYWGDNHDTFKVNEQGEIEFVATGGAALMSRDRYGDFILRVEYVLEAAAGNSGIFLRAPRAGRQSYIGMEFQLHGDHLAPVGDDMTGAIYLQQPPLVNAGNPPGEWNSLEIICQGSMLKATLNGQVVQDIDLSTHPELKHRIRRGFIGLQDHHDPVRFRNVRIKPL
jgi:hypothetical protein